MYDIEMVVLFDLDVLLMTIVFRSLKVRNNILRETRDDIDFLFTRSMVFERSRFLWLL
jgi:hypothetical protein